MSSYPYRSTVHVASEQEHQSLLTILATHAWTVELHQQNALLGEQRLLAVDFAKNAEWHAFEAHLTYIGHGEHRLAH